MALTAKQQLIKDAWERYKALQAAFLDIVGGTAKSYTIDGRNYTSFNLDELQKAMDAAEFALYRYIHGSSVLLSQVIQKYN